MSSPSDNADSANFIESTPRRSAPSIIRRKGPDTAEGVHCYVEALEVERPLIRGYELGENSRGRTHVTGIADPDLVDGLSSKKEIVGALLDNKKRGERS